jgi:phage shock protein PspC (stress-responsive transcriptional regulator)
MKPKPIIILLLIFIAMNFSYQSDEEGNTSFTIGDSTEFHEFYFFDSFTLLLVAAAIYLLYRSHSENQAPKKRLRDLKRNETDAQLAGICSSISEHYDIPIWISRASFVLLGIADGIGVIIYIVLWIFMPSEVKSTETKDTESNQSGDDNSE